jgi:hypothetical protein
VVMSNQDSPFIGRFRKDLGVSDSFQAGLVARFQVDTRFAAEETIDYFSIEIIVRQKAHSHRRV